MDTTQRPVHEAAPWHRRIAAVLPNQMLLKSVGISLFLSVFFVAYFYLLNHPARPVTVMPFTALDRLIGFSPWAVPLYVSLWVYVSLPPALLASRQPLLRYAAGMTGICVAGLAVFYFWPSAVPAADIDWRLYPSVAFLKNLDASGNACPSLHVATAFFSGLWLHHSLRHFDAPRWLLLVNGLWCAGIVYSTLATRQHVVCLWGRSCPEDWRWVRWGPGCPCALTCAPRMPASWAGPRCPDIARNCPCPPLLPFHFTLRGLRRAEPALAFPLHREQRHRLRLAANPVCAAAAAQRPGPLHL
jgi:hypothetical protein